MAGADVVEVARNGLAAWPVGQAEMPLAELEFDDWVTLQTDLVSFLAQVMTVRMGARWEVREDPDGPRGFRCVLRVVDDAGVTHDVDPFQIVSLGCERSPIEVAWMPATTELTLGAPAYA